MVLCQLTPPLWALFRTQPTFLSVAHMTKPQRTVTPAILSPPGNQLNARSLDFLLWTQIHALSYSVLHSQQAFSFLINDWVPGEELSRWKD